MKRNRFQQLVFVFLLFLSQVHETSAHETDRVHPGLTKNANALLETRGYERVSAPYFIVDGSCNDIREGSIVEDAFVGWALACGVTSLSWMEHFYNPMNAKGLSSGTGTALDKAATEYQEAVTAYSSCTKQRAYLQLGRVVHLLQDMTSPAHVHSDAHVPWDKDDFEIWSSTPDYAPRYELFANGTQITEALSLSSHFMNLAYKTYYATSFAAVLKETKTTPINPTSELARMFPGKVHYVPIGWWGISYWVIDGVGEYRAQLALSDWWESEDDPGYYYIENANGENGTGLVPAEMRFSLTNRDSPMGPNSKTIMTRWAEVLFPEAVNYSAGLMKYFHDRTHGGVDDHVAPAKPAGLKARAGNQKASFTWTGSSQDICGDTLTDLGVYHVYYSTDPKTLSRTWATAMKPAVELTGLANNKTYFVCVKAVDTRGNESACSDTVTVKPAEALWVHQSGGPSGSYTSISAALAAAAAGAIKTVMVGPGNYTETGLTIGTGYIADGPTYITLMSERGPAETTINGQGETTFNIQSGDYSRIIGFTIRHKTKQGNGIDCWFNQNVLIANNIFIANSVGVYVGGAQGYVDQDASGIYNNIFRGNIRGISGANDLQGQTRVYNNIFEGNDYSISLGNAKYFIIQYNDFYGNRHGNSVVEVGSSVGHNTIGLNLNCSPNFVDLSASTPDFHLKPISCARDTGANFFFIDPISRAYELWSECDPKKMRVDLGAFGGPFAYVDNNGNRIPDCDELRGVPLTVGMMQNAVDFPIPLTARTPETEATPATPSSSITTLSDAGTQSELTFTIVSGPYHGTLSGTAPDLTYTPAPGYAGEDSFSFTVAGEMGVSEPAFVTIKVKASNAQPLAADQTIRLKTNSSVAVTLQGSDADGDELTFAVDSGPASGSLQCLMPPDCAFWSPSGFTGEVSFRYHVNDGMADSAPAIVRIIVSADPGIELAAPRAAEPATNASTFTIAWAETVPDSGGTIALYRDWDAVGFDGELIVADIPVSDPANSHTWDISTLADGTYYVYAANRDAGGTALVYAPGPVIIDRTGPLVSVTPDSGSYSTAQLVTLSADELATIYATTDGSAPTTSSPLYAGPVAVSDALTLRWIAVDAVGNKSAEGSAAYIIDTVPPMVGIDPLPDPLRQAAATLTGSMEIGTTVTLVADKPATFDPVNYPSNGTWSSAVSGLDDGPVNFTATATDAAGNTASATTGTTFHRNSPPVLDPVGEQTTNENQTLFFAVTATDPDGTIPTLSAQNLPPGADFTGGTFTWTPTYDQSDTYPVTFIAADEEFQDSELVAINVMHVNRAPTVPLISAPQTQSEVETVRPNLVLENSIDPDGDSLCYEFEIYADPAMTNLVASSNVAEQPSLTSWTVTVDLADNTRHYWRARAADSSAAGAAFSQWTDADFVVNVANEPPVAFAAASPAAGADVAVLTPELGVTNSSDPDGDALWYSFFVYTDEGLTNLVGSAAGIPAGTGGSTAWTVAPPLADNTWHFWKAVATDEHGLSTGTASAAFFVNTANDAPTPPTMASPVDGMEVAATTVTLTLSNASDPDGDTLTYIFELDAVATFDGPGRIVSDPLSPGSGTTSWSVANLVENTRYYWRCKAIDGWTESPWTTASFFVNVANDAPGAPTPRNPGAGARVESVTPRLEVYAASDPDLDTLVYDYEVYAEPPGNPVAAGNAAATEWQVTPPLGDNAWHSWRVRAVDEHDLAGPWSGLTAFFTNNNGIDDPPTITVIEPAASFVQAGGTFPITWVDGDPDSDATIVLYRDSDGVGENGEPITSGLSEDQDGTAGSYLWNLDGVPTGTYHIYGVIGDGTSSRSDYAPGTVTVDGATPTTVANPRPGTYAGQVIVTLTTTDDTDPKPVIHYTVDGTTPTLASPVYAAPLLFAATTTLRFFAVDASGRQEAVQGPYGYTITAPTNQAVTVLTPNGGEVIASGSAYTIRWGAPFSATRFDLAYSTNNGGSYTNIATGRTGNSYTWSVPKPAANSPQCRVRVIGKNCMGSTIGTDVSDRAFAIEVVRLTAPNGGEIYSRAAIRTLPITWVANGTSQTVNKVTLSYSMYCGSSWTTITSLKTNPGTYAWTLPNTNSSRYRVRVQLYRNNTALGSDMSNANFTVGP